MVLVANAHLGVQMSDLRHPKCLDCGSFRFYEGPQGGLSENIMCMQCGSAYCYAAYDGQQLSMDRIDNSVWTSDDPEERVKLLDGRPAPCKNDQGLVTCYDCGQVVAKGLCGCGIRGIS